MELVDLLESQTQKLNYSFHLFMKLELMKFNLIKTKATNKKWSLLGFITFKFHKTIVFLML